MPDLIRVEYGQTGKSTQNNELGMREMQARAFESRDQQYLLIKAPPASGKSRALMFLALDKLLHQGLERAIVAVPETSIAGSFDNTDLTSHGFYADWTIAPGNNLCHAGSDASDGKIKRFKRFKHDAPQTLADRVLVCTHATLRYAFSQLDVSDFDNTLLAIDEFHHVSADEDNQLGNLLDAVMHGSSAHVVAMTGSYFRGDAKPVLLPEDEALFSKVTYTYYEQLNGYQHLKSLGIGYHFYTGTYFEAVDEVLDPGQKTIVHIPNVNSRESTKDKHQEVDRLLDSIGTVEGEDQETGILTLRVRGNKRVKVANLVDDSPRRAWTMEYLRTHNEADAVDVIIALGMAKEGFDFPPCSHVLTIGYRNSLTEVVQIIGRATRDYPGKTHAQFTNLIAQPDADDADVKEAVNNMLKAITVSLLMEQVLAPNFQFRPRARPGGEARSDQPSIEIDDNGGTVDTGRVSDVLNTDADRIMAELVNEPKVQAALTGNGIESEVINMTSLPEVIQRLHPTLAEDDVEAIRQGMLTQMALTDGGGLYSEDELPEGADVVNPEPAGEPGEAATPRIVPGAIDGGDESQEPGGNAQFLRINDKFVNIEHLRVDLIDQVNPFQGAFEVLSKSVTSSVLQAIQNEVAGKKIEMTEEEAVILWPKIKVFTEEQGREPQISANDPWERRYAEALMWIRRKKRERSHGA